MSNTGERHLRFYAAMAESIVDTADEEIFDEAGSDAWSRSEHVRQALLDGVKAHEQRKLRDAYQEYQAQMADFSARKASLPTSPEARRELLNQVFLRLSQEQQAALTLQHRGFKNMSDEDVASCLAQLEALGALETDDEEDSE